MQRFSFLCSLLSGISIEKCSFYLSCQFNAKSGAIEQLTLGERPVDRDRRVGHPRCTAISTIKFLFDFVVLENLGNILL